MAEAGSAAAAAAAAAAGLAETTLPSARAEADTRGGGGSADTAAAASAVAALPDEQVPPDAGGASLGASIDDLPNELLQTIFAFLPGPSSLRAAACVCREWLLAASIVQRDSIRSFRDRAISGGLRLQRLSFADHAASCTIAKQLRERRGQMIAAGCGLVIVFGGIVGSSSFFNDTHAFDLERRRWMRVYSISPAPPPRAFGTLVASAHGFLLHGGYMGTNSHARLFGMPPVPRYAFYNTTYALRILAIHRSTDTVSATWEQLEPSPESIQVMGRALHSAAVVGNYMHVFHGRIQPDPETSRIIPDNSMCVMNLLTREWSQVSMPVPLQPRTGHRMIFLPPHSMLVVGGWDATSQQDFATPRCVCIDLRTMNWKTVSNVVGPDVCRMPVVLAQLSATRVAALPQTIIPADGINDNPRSAVLEIFDLSRLDLRLDEPSPDSPWKHPSARLAAEGTQALTHAAVRLHRVRVAERGSLRRAAAANAASADSDAREPRDDHSTDAAEQDPPHLVPIPNLPPISSRAILVDGQALVLSMEDTEVLMLD